MKRKKYKKNFFKINFKIFKNNEIILIKNIQNIYFDINK